MTGDWVLGERTRPGPANAAGLLRRVVPLGIVHASEWSFKLLPGRVLTDRVLVTFAARRNELSSVSGLLGLERAIVIPAPVIARLTPHLVATDWLHVGFEGGDGRRVCKIYLESQGGVLALNGLGEPALIHRSWKWDLDQPEEVVEGTYRGWANPSPAQVEAAVDAAIERGGVLGDVLRSVVLRARERSAATFLLVVSEEGTERRSIDLNLYPANLVGADIVCDLEPAMGWSGVREPRCVLDDRFLASRVGHIAAGRSRHDEDFLTMYFASDTETPT